MAFIDTAESRETSREIMEAILYVAGNNEAEAVRIWEEPTEPEMLAIWERATKNGLIPAEDFCWGVEGNAWAKTVEGKKTDAPSPNTLPSRTAPLSSMEPKIEEKWQEPASEKEIEAARDEYQNDDIEIDDDANRSEAGDGTGVWISAWVWVSKDKLEGD